MKTKKLAAAPAQATAPTPDEHIYIATVDSNPDPKTAAVTVHTRVQLRNPLRRTSTDVGCSPRLSRRPTTWPGPTPTRFSA